MKKILYLILCSFFVATAIQAQSFSPDRPGIGNGSFITPKQMGGIDAGFQVRHTDFGRQADFGQLLIRYGVIENLEFRALVNSYSSLKLDLLPSSTEGFQDLGVGLKYNVHSSGENHFSFSILTELSVPLGHDIYTSDEFVPTFAYLIDYDISERWSFSTNMGYSFGVGNLEDSFLFTATPSFQVKNNENASIYFGYAGIYDDNSYTQHFLELGGVLNFDSGIKVDVNAGYEVDRVALFMGAGLAVSLF